MHKFEFFPLLGALAMAAFLVGGAGSARANEITFGTTSPSSGTCAASPLSGDEGQICNNGLQFTAADGTVLTANGYKNWSVSGGMNASTASALTLKIVPPNSADEGGLGENAYGPNISGNGGSNTQTCTDNPGGGNPSTPCEIGLGAAVTVSSNGTLISDVLVGSVQAGYEAFQIWTEINGVWSQFGGDLSLDGGNLGAYSTTACNQFNSSDACLIDLTTAATAVGVVDLLGNTPSDVLLTGVSLAPAPIIGKGLPVMLGVGGLLFGSWLLDRSRKRRLPGAIGHAAA
jgi:hypothetical protein